MPRMSERLHLMQASMQWSDSDKQTRADFDRILSRGADVVGLTEVSKTNGNLALLEAAAEPLGYTVLWDAETNGGEVALAVRSGLTVCSHGATFVHKAEPGNPRGGHSARFVQWASIAWNSNIVTVCEAHWVTGYGRRESRREKHHEMTDAIIELVEQHGRGERLAFFMGDVNVDERKDRGQRVGSTHARFTEAGLTTIWDELGVYLNTHGRRVIDIIGSYDPDRRVSADSVKVWGGHNSDHRPVSAWYDVLTPRRKTVAK